MTIKIVRVYNITHNYPEKKENPNRVKKYFKELKSQKCIYTHK